LTALGGLGTLLIPRLVAAMWAAAPAIEAASAAEGAAAGAAFDAAESAAIVAGGPEVAGAVGAVGAQGVAAAGVAGTTAGLTFVGSLIGVLVAVPVANAAADAFRSFWHDVVGGVDLGQAGSLEEQAQRAHEQWLRDHPQATATPLPVDNFDQQLADRLNAGVPAVTAASTNVGNAMTGPITNAWGAAETSVIGSLSALVDDFKSKWGVLAGIASDAADAIYGPMDRAAARSANERARAAQQAILDDKKSTAVQKQDARDRLSALQKENLGIVIAMAGRGEVTKAAYDKLIRQLTHLSTTGSQEVRDAAALALAELAALKAASDKIRPPHWATHGGQATPTATGGYRPANQPLLVGEKGPELWVPRTAGTMIPNSALASVSPMSLTVNVSAGGDTSLGTARRFGQAVLDTVASGLREQTARARAGA
jgi:hypothetical protein